MKNTQLNSDRIAEVDTRGGLPAVVTAAQDTGARCGGSVLLVNSVHGRFDLEHHPDECPCCRAALPADLPNETISEHETIELPAIKPFVGATGALL